MLLNDKGYIFTHGKEMSKDRFGFRYRLIRTPGAVSLNVSISGLLSDKLASVLLLTKDGCQHILRKRN